MRLHRFSHRYDSVDEQPDLIEIETRRQSVLGEPARGFVFERQRNVGQRRYRATPRRHQKRRGGSLWAAHRRDDDVGIENTPHTKTDIISPVILQGTFRFFAATIASPRPGEAQRLLERPGQPMIAAWTAFWNRSTFER